MLECRVLYFGDIIGKPGRNYVYQQLPALREKYRPDFIFANAENATHGFGLTLVTAQELHQHGIDGLSLGNHAWDQKSFWEEIDQLPYVCRPANFPENTPGRTILLQEYQGEKLAVINLLGRAGMRSSLDCPFQIGQKLLQTLQTQGVSNVLLDFHAETTAEKYALGWFLSSQGILAVLGTHTHVPTADERFLHPQTAFISDIGMCGPQNSIIGCKIDPIVERFLNGKPNKLEVAQGPCVLNAVFLRLDLEQHRALSIERVQRIED